LPCLGTGRNPSRARAKQPEASDRCANTAITMEPWGTNPAIGERVNENGLAKRAHRRELASQKCRSQKLDSHDKGGGKQKGGQKPSGVLRKERKVCPKKKTGINSAALKGEGCQSGTVLTRKKNKDLTPKHPLLAHYKSRKLETDALKNRTAQKPRAEKTKRILKKRPRQGDREGKAQWLKVEPFAKRESKIDDEAAFCDQARELKSKCANREGSTRGSRERFVEGRSEVRMLGDASTPERPGTEVREPRSQIKVSEQKKCLLPENYELRASSATGGRG